MCNGVANPRHWVRKRQGNQANLGSDSKRDYVVFPSIRNRVNVLQVSHIERRKVMLGPRSFVRRVSDLSSRQAFTRGDESSVGTSILPATDRGLLSGYRHLLIE